MVQGINERYATASNGRGAGAPVSLDDVAIDRDGVFTESGQINSRAQGAADQALYFDGAAALLASGSFTAHSAASGTGQHAVFGGDPAFTFPPQEWGHLVFDGGGTDNFGVSELHQHGAFGVAGIVAGDSNISGLLGRSAAWTHSVS